MSTLYLDLETFSEVPITAGTNAYAEKAEILLAAYAIDDQAVEVIDMTQDRAGSIKLINLILRDDFENIVIHNSYFDRTVIRNVLGIDINIEKIHDTMVRALAHGLPGSLGKLCEIFGLPVDQAKDKRGAQLIQLFCKPRPSNHKLTRATYETNPEEWKAFIEYAKKDIEAMRTLYKRMPRWNTDNLVEPSLWSLDQCINDRGIAVDTDFVSAAISVTRSAKDALAARSARLSEGALSSTTRRAETLKYIEEAYGVVPDNLQAGTVERMLEGDLDPGLRELLTIRLQATTTSVAKYEKLQAALSSDGRLRGTLQFCGASRTGRWAGRIFQPQNLPRPSMSAEDIDLGIKAIKTGCAPYLYDNIMGLASNALRGVLIAPPGKKLVISDLSNIEGRVLAWLAGEQWKLDAFRAFDEGKGPDLYKLAYARAFNVSPGDVTKDQRQLGKIMELALGYQGAVGAFGSMASLYGMGLPEDHILQLVKAWRKSNPQISSFWYELEDAVSAAVEHGVSLSCRMLKIVRERAWLRIVLPSGRSLCYASPRVEEGKLSYMGVNGYTRKWERIKTYGGKLVENVTQAVARDVMAANMLRVEYEGYEVVLSVHDELITEVPDVAIYNSGQLSELLATNPAWAKGLPLAASGFECKRYRKD